MSDFNSLPGPGDLSNDFDPQYERDERDDLDDWDAEDFDSDWADE